MYILVTIKHTPYFGEQFLEFFFIIFPSIGVQESCGCRLFGVLSAVCKTHSAPAPHVLDCYILHWKISLFCYIFQIGEA